MRNAAGENTLPSRFQGPAVQAKEAEQAHTEVGQVAGQATARAVALILVKNTL